MELLLSFEYHRDTLVTILENSFVDVDIPIEKLEKLVGNLTTHNYISFYVDEISSEGTDFIHVIEDDGIRGEVSEVRPCPEGFQLANWKEMKIRIIAMNDV
ncbi:hypothetical protein PTKIN_Ptkin07bG0080100 [Pterospermum kingtungense]